ncbi:MAG: PAS domain S-box protein [Desulfobacteraceae bacterium]|nr:PAS domain S-box protein [Desulfobacteraceae bacterium]
MKSTGKKSAHVGKQSAKKSTKLLHENRLAQEQLRTLLKFLPDPVFVFTVNNTIEYINPAFERIFGWTFEEVKGKNIKFIPDHMSDQAKQGMRQLFKNKSVNDFETQRYTKDGRILDILINGSIFYDADNKPAGQILILRDITFEKRMAKSNQVMSRISNALHHYHKLGDLIALINKEIKELISVEGAFILLADKSKNQLYFLSAQYKDLESEKKFKKIRFSADQGVSGRVYKTGEPIIISDVSKCSYFLRRVDDETDLVTKNILSVPILLKDKTIGVVAVVNKMQGEFDNTDIELLSMVTNTIALPIENTRIHEELRKSYKELKALNHSKDKVINHLAHEIKTPAAVLGASLSLLSKKFKTAGVKNSLIENIFIRGQRNLNRILDIQYEVEDLLREKDFKAFNILNKLLDACKDELSVLVESETENFDIINRVHEVIENLFGPKEIKSESIVLDEFLTNQIKKLKTGFGYRNCLLNVKADTNIFINMPPVILETITKGLIRNAFEYTPDNGKIDIFLRKRSNFSELIIKDYGVGFTKEKLHLVFENYFSPPESINYSTRKPYDFNAGGRGFDLLRIKVFSERYDFSISIDSKRCEVIPKDEDTCPGDIKLCQACTSIDDCFNSGGTSIHIKFQ